MDTPIKRLTYFLACIILAFVCIPYITIYADTNNQTPDSPAPLAKTTDSAIAPSDSASALSPKKDSSDENKQAPSEKSSEENLDSSDDLDEAVPGTNSPDTLGAQTMLDMNTTLRQDSTVMVYRQDGTTLYFDSILLAANYINANLGPQENVSIKVLKAAVLTSKISFNKGNVSLYAEHPIVLTLGSETGSDYKPESAIEVGANTTLDIKNITIDASQSSRNELVFVHGQNSKLILHEGAHLYGNSPQLLDVSYGSAIKAENGATFVMNKGSKVSYCATNNASNKTTPNKTPYDGCIFIGKGKKNAHPSSFIMNGGEISHNNSYAYGGAIYCCEDSSVQINSGIIANNTASTKGGAIYIEGKSSCSLKDCEIKENAALHENINDTDAYGGGIHADHEASLKLDGVSMTRNKSHYGGAISLDNSSSLEILGQTSISTNYAINYGGNIHATNECTITQKSGVLEKGQAQYGGSCYLSEACTYRLKEGIIRNNEAMKDGGGFYIYNASRLIMSNGQIRNNIAHNRGGGVHVDKEPIGEVIAAGPGLIMSGGTITQNQAKKYGAGAYIGGYTNNRPYATISGTAYIWDNKTEAGKQNNLFGKEGKLSYGELYFKDLTPEAKIGITYPRYMGQGDHFGYSGQNTSRIQLLYKVVNDENSELFAFQEGTKVIWHKGYKIRLQNILNIIGYPPKDDGFTYKVHIKNTWGETRPVYVNDKKYLIYGGFSDEIEGLSCPSEIFAYHPAFQVQVTQIPHADNEYSYETTYDYNSQSFNKNYSTVPGEFKTRPIRISHSGTYDLIFTNTLIEPTPTDLSFDDSPALIGSLISVLGCVLFTITSRLYSKKN